MSSSPTIYPFCNLIMWLCHIHRIILAVNWYWKKKHKVKQLTLWWAASQLRIDYLSTFVGGCSMITHGIQLFIWIFSGNDYNVISTTMNEFNPAIDRVVIDDYLAFLPKRTNSSRFLPKWTYHQKWQQKKWNKTTKKQ